MPRLEGTLATIQRWDERACTRLNRAIRVRALLHLFRAVSWLGNGIFWYGLMLALLLVHGAEAALPVLHMVAAGLACTFLYRLLKKGTLRPRPYEVHAHIAAGATPLDKFSFPSGHTLHAVAFSVLASAYFPQLAILLAPLTLAVAASRIILGLHYPSDVLAGAALGAFVAFASLNLG
ncbi:MAG: phosphatase PAP2 family protein [Candidatus Parcubacteria bacterium]|nr:phosphatase PAP2 family protein [Burkholderiales bacterium]